jgi:hypothetical protein
MVICLSISENQYSHRTINLFSQAEITFLTPGEAGDIIETAEIAIQEETMLCPDCRVESAADDDFCRRCGADLHAPVRSLVVAQPRLPVVFTNPQLPRVAAGVGAVAVGVGLELLRRGFLTRLITRGARSGLTSLAAAKPPNCAKDMKFRKLLSTSIELFGEKNNVAIAGVLLEKK